MPRRVVVGLSGGVDSAVSALILKNKGYDVIGVHMMNWDGMEEGTSSCPRTKDESDARMVAHRLSIPFYSINFVKEYWNEVFTKMVDGYSRGKTIVPDIDCNSKIKFHHLHSYALERLSADFIATGHYASTSRGDFNDKETIDGKCRLLRGRDSLKDQTYFLCTLKQEQLRRAIFPLGSMTKNQVKNMAFENGLVEASRRKESMGVCFVGKKKDFGQFIEEYIEGRCGSIIDCMSGEKIGDHCGVHNFTVGKRLSVGSKSHLGYFVQKLDGDNGIVYAVESSTHPSLYSTQFTVHTPEWIVDSPSKDSRVLCRVQRSHSPIPCSITLDGSLTTVIPSRPLRAVCPGQMCVFYRDRECMGGGEVISINATLKTQ
uniref:tRNA-5-taurinomethyluridine 2-sulfurtransferase n=1 Tax=Pristionchus pacificus TaxID=54126 RepID=A0A8R1YT62_PRIPA